MVREGVVRNLVGSLLREGVAICIGGATMPRRGV